MPKAAFAKTFQRILTTAILVVGTVASAAAISFSITTSSPYCAGTSTTVNYNATGSTLNAGNIVSVQLSDASGSFASPVTIGAQQTVALTGSISITFPPGTSTGMGYRIRIVLSNTAETSADNGSNLTINAQTVPTISIVSDRPQNTRCDAQTVNFTATPTGMGATPVYQWKKNNVNVGGNTIIYADGSINQNDVIKVVMTSTAVCPATNPTESNSITMSVLATVTPSVTITGPSAICAGVSNNFNAVPVNGGASPSYQWKKNGGNVGNNSSLYSDASLINGDVITCVLTSSRACVTTPTATSNSINVTITPSVTPTITIASDPLGTVGAGSVIYFSATSTNGGLAPTYQWKKNGVNTSTTNAYQASDFVNGDVISATLTSDAVCAQPITATSNNVTLSIDDKFTRAGFAWEPRKTQTDGLGVTIPRKDAAGFSIGTKAYIGTGSVMVSSTLTYRKDFWEYDPNTDVWTQRADFAGDARYNAVGFAVGNKGFIGTGLTATGAKKDMWQYDPVTNTWIGRLDVPGNIREQAFAFGIGAKGYLGGGWATGPGDFNDFYEFDPNANTWTPKANFGGGKRMGAAAFSVDVKGYVAAGYSTTSSLYYKDIHEYDPGLNQWTKKADMPGAARTRATAFSIAGNGYVGMGYSGTEYLGQFWQYSVAANTWNPKAYYTGPMSTSFGAGISVGNKGFVYKDGTWTEFNIFTTGSFNSRLCSTEAVAVSFDVSGFTFGANNFFTTQVSTQENFSVISALGTVASTASSGIVNATVPTSLASNTYYFRVVSSNPVMSTFAEKIVITNVPTVHTITAQGGSTICKDIQANFTSNMGGTGFTWYRNADVVGMDASTYSESALVNGDVIKSVKTYTNGCKAPLNVTSNLITMTIREATKPVVTFSANTLSSTPATTYQWYMDGATIPGANAQVYKITKTAIYKVRISDGSGCTAFSDDLPAVFTGLEDDLNNLLSVYPNPFGDEMILTINDEMIIKGCSFSVLNDLGQTVVNSQKAAKTNKINLSGKSSGLYLVRLSVDGQTLVKRILKY